MDPLDPSVLEATGGPTVSTDQVVSVTPDDVDPAWSTVEFADGRTETHPTSTAETMPKVPAPPPMGPPPPVGAGNPPAVPGELGLLSVGDPVAAQNPTGDQLVSGVQDAAAGSGAGFQDLGVRVDSSAGPGGLPPAQVDSGAAVLAPGSTDATAPFSETQGVDVQTAQTAVPVDQLAEATQAGYGDVAAGMDEQARGQQAAREAENLAATEHAAAREQKLQDDLYRAEIHTEEAQRVVQVIEDTPIEQDFYADAPGRQVAAWVALALSGFLSGATKGANPALSQMMQSLNAAQDRFIQNQRANKTSKLAQRTKGLGDAKAAEASIRMQLGKVIEDHAKLQAQKAGLDELPPALSTFGAQTRVKAVEAQQALGLHVERRTNERFSAERRAAPPTPVFQGDRDLQALGVDPKVHREQAMDPKGANLGGMVQGAQRLQKISAELEAIAKRHGGDLPQQNLISWDTIGASKLAGRMGSDSAKDQLRARQLIEEAKLAFKQTINIKSVDSENEGKNFNVMMDTGEPTTTMRALREKAVETNQRAVATASGFSRNPQGYLQFIERGMGSNPGVGGAGAAPQPKRSTGFRVSPEEPTLEANQPQAATTGPTTDDTGGGPATRPLAQSPQASEPGTPDAASPDPNDEEKDPVKLQTLQTIKSAGTEAGLDGDALVRIIRFESSGKPTAQNASGATGLIQWMPAVFKGMTKPPGYENVTHADLKDLTAEEQIPLILQYFEDKGLKPGADVGEMYLAVAAPALVNKPDSTVAYKKGSAAWTQNAQWRPADGGDITAGSIRARARKF